MEQSSAVKQLISQPQLLQHLYWFKKKSLKLIFMKIMYTKATVSTEDMHMLIRPRCHVYSEEDLPVPALQSHARCLFPSSPSHALFSYISYNAMECSYLTKLCWSWPCLCGSNAAIINYTIYNPPMTSHPHP